MLSLFTRWRKRIALCRAISECSFKRLQGSVEGGLDQLVDVALAGGQDLHFRPASSPTPLQAAAFKNRTETMKHLIAKGATKADFDVKKCRWTSIRCETIRVLLELGVDVPPDVAEGVRNGNWISDQLDHARS